MIPVLEIMARLVKDTNEEKDNHSDENHNNEKVALPSSLSSDNNNNYNNNVSSMVESSLSSADENTRVEEHQYGMPVWGASSGLDWQGMCFTIL